VAPLLGLGAALGLESGAQALRIAAGLGVVQNPRRLDPQQHPLLARLARGVAVEPEVLLREAVDRAIGLLALDGLDDTAADLDPA